MSLLVLKLSIVYDKVTELMDTVLNQTFLSSNNWPSDVGPFFRVSHLKKINFRRFINKIFSPSGARCAEKFEWGGFSTFRRWRSRVFLNLTSLTSHQIFDAHFLETNDLSPSRFHFSVSFIPRSWFESDGLIAYPNEWDWSEKERCLFALTNL